MKKFLHEYFVVQTKNSYYDREHMSLSDVHLEPLRFLELKHGRSLLLDYSLVVKLQHHITNVREEGGDVSSRVVMAPAHGLILPIIVVCHLKHPLKLTWAYVTIWKSPPCYAQKLKFILL